MICHLVRMSFTLGAGAEIKIIDTMRSATSQGEVRIGTCYPPAGSFQVSSICAERQIIRQDD